MYLKVLLKLAKGPLRCPTHPDGLPNDQGVEEAQLILCSQKPNIWKCGHTDKKSVDKSGHMDTKSVDLIGQSKGKHLEVRTHGHKKCRHKWTPGHKKCRQNWTVKKQTSGSVDTRTQKV